MKQAKVDAWWEEHFPGQRLLGSVPVSSTAGPGDGISGGQPSPYEIAHHGQLRGLDSEARLVLYERLVMLFLTEDHLHVATVGGMFVARPKDLRHSLDREGLRVQWFDYSELKNGWRNFLIQIPDGTWMGVGATTTILGREAAARTGADAFVDWLGPNGKEIDWRNPPPLEAR